jgi:hypothetical protein
LTLEKISLLQRKKSVRVNMFVWRKYLHCGESICLWRKYLYCGGNMFVLPTLAVV